MENLRKIMINGKMIDLNSADIEQLKSYLEDIKNKKKEQKDILNNLLSQIDN